jgi:HK97 family phage major capsid protein
LKLDAIGAAFRDAEERAYKAAQEILDRAKAENRALTGEEREAFERASAEMEEAGEQLRDHMERQERREAQRAAMEGRGHLLDGQHRPETVEGRALRADETFQSRAGGRPATSEEFGEFVRSLAHGERRAAAEGTGSAGGYLVPTPLSARILDLARSKTVVMQAGAQAVPMEAETLGLAMVTEDPQPGWRNENAAIDVSDITFGKVTLTARSLAVLVKASFELMEDAPNFPQVLENSLAQAFALKLDAAALYGSGTAPEPQGVYTADDVTVTPLDTNGAVPSYDALIDAAARVYGANYTPTGAILSTRTEAELAKLKDENSAYLAVPAYLANLPRLATTAVKDTQTQGTSHNASDLFVADFSQLLVGIRTQFKLRVLQEAFASTGQVGFLGWLRADVQIARPDAFQVVTGIVPAVS